MVVSLTLITTARRSPLERFGLNVRCGQLLDAARADRGCDLAMAYLDMENFYHRPRHQSRAVTPVVCVAAGIRINPTMSFDSVVSEFSSLTKS